MAEGNSQEVIPWGRDVERRHAWLLHTENLAVGPVERFYTGEEGDRYVSAIDGSVVTAPVLYFGTGHALLAKPEAFIEIGPEEASIYINTIEGMRNTIANAMRAAVQTLRARPHTPNLPMALIVSALRSQLHALEALASEPPPPESRPDGL